MPYFSQKYIETALNSMCTYSNPTGQTLTRLRSAGTALYILNVDIKKSTSIPLELRREVISNLNVHFGQEIVSRDGWLHRVTDGVDAFFVDLDAALTTAIAIYHRKRQIQENTIKPLIAAHYSKHRDAERRLDYRDVDYRLVMLRFPDAQKITCLDPARDGNPLERLKTRWYEVSSRYGNKELFLISDAVLNDLSSRNDGSGDLFSQGTAVPFAPTQECGNDIKVFFDEKLWNYSNPAFTAFPSEGDFDIPNCTNGPVLDALYLAAFAARRHSYDNWSRGAAAQTVYSFEPYRIEHGHVPRSLPGAIVIGDVNLDLVTYIKDGEFPINDGEFPVSVPGHVQLQQDIEKVVAGKGMNIARVLQECGKFDPIVLVAKLGMDREMGYIVQDLKSYSRVKPLFMLSNTLPTGTSILLRRQGHNSSLLTISDKPNANSDLRAEEVKPYHSDLLKNDYLFVSGYCLLDDRIVVVERILEDMAKIPGKRAILEFSPARLLWSQFSESDERKRKLKSIIQSCFVVAFEEGAFGGLNTEQYMLQGVPYALKVNRNFDGLFERRPNTLHWNRVKDIPTDPEKSLGLFSQVVTDYVSKEFLKPRIALCSQSPRRYELLASIYGHSSIYHHLPRAMKNAGIWEFNRNEFDDEMSLKRELLRVTAGKADAGINQLHEARTSADAVGQTDLDSCVVALASDLVVVVPHGSKYIAVEKPESADDHIGKVRKIFTDYYDGRSHTVLSCTCFIDLKPFSNTRWNKAEVDSFSAEFKKLIAELELSPPQELLDGTKEWKCAFGQTTVTVWFHFNSSVVSFKDLKRTEINEYAASGEWRNKGGGYAIQGNAAYLIREIQGSITNIVGLPMPDVYRILRDHFGIWPIN